MANEKYNLTDEELAELKKRMGSVIDYCKEHSITIITDGSNAGQVYAVKGGFELTEDSEDVSIDKLQEVACDSDMFLAADSSYDYIAPNGN